MAFFSLRFWRCFCFVEKCRRDCTQRKNADSTPTSSRAVKMVGDAARKGKTDSTLKSSRAVPTPVLEVVGGAACKGEKKADSTTRSSRAVPHPSPGKWWATLHAKGTTEKWWATPHDKGKVAAPQSFPGRSPPRSWKVVGGAARKGKKLTAPGKWWAALHANGKS